MGHIEGHIDIRDEVFEYQDPEGCATKKAIIAAGGEVIENSGGTVSVFIMGTDGTLTYKPLTKPCCDILSSGYTFDINTQQCRWGADCCEDLKPFKVVLNPMGNDGVIFTVDESSNEDCSLDISFDYLIQLDCNDIYNQIRGATEGSVSNNTKICYQLLLQQQELLNQITALETQLTSLETQLSQTPYVIQCVTAHNDILTYCLTEAGLSQWESILGANAYNTWLNSNGTNTSIYDCEKVSSLLNLDGGTNTLVYECNVPVTAIDVLISQIETLQNQINQVRDEYANILTLIEQYGCNGDDVECGTVSSILETLDVCMTLELVNPTTGLLETIYEESIFNIGAGQIATYLTTTVPNTGLITTGTSGNQNQADIATTAYTQSISCTSIAKLLMNELSEDLPQSGITEIQELVQESFNSPWLNFETSIIDQSILDLIYNEKIKISFKIKDCCVDFSILVDRIRLDRNCVTVDAIEYDITKSPSFNMVRICDNKKSWLANEDFKHREFDLKLRETEYDINNYKLAINSKEVDLNISPSNAIEQDLFCYVKDNECILECITATTYSCPTGFTNNVTNTDCVRITTTAATYNGTGPTIVSGDTSTGYGNNGAHFYPDQTNQTQLPLIRTSNVTYLENQTGATVSASTVVSSGNTFWENSALNTTDGRLNNVGISASTTEWLGFANCIEITEGKTYYIGIAGDNYCRLTIDSTQLLDLSSTAWDNNFNVWHVIPYYLEAGTHVIAMEGRNDVLDSSFGVEIYETTSLSTLTAATNTTEAGVIFSSIDRVGGQFDMGETVRFSCPTGYTFNNCDATFINCSKFEYSAITGTTCCYQPISVECMSNHDFDSILSAQTYLCQSGSTSGCSVDSIWGIDAVLGCETLYTNDSFYVSTGITDTPTQEQYISELSNIATTLGLDFSSGATTVTFSNTIYCDGTVFINKNFRIDLNLDITTNCTKLFQDNVNFEFQDGDEYDFN